VRFRRIIIMPNELPADRNPMAIDADTTLDNPPLPSAHPFGLSPATMGLVLGLLGVLAFSFTLPFTRIAAPELGGAFVGMGRALVAAVLAAGVLAWKRERLPPRATWRGIGLVAIGCVFGFGLLSSIAMQTVPAVHGIVVVGILPPATAVMAVLRAGERPGLPFWLACGAGFASVLVFAWAQGAGSLHAGDLWLLAAVVLAALGYAEGAVLARSMGGWRVISWALVFSLPVLAVVVGTMVLRGGLPDGSASAWWCFLYLAAFSMYLGFFPWYAGLAMGGVARVGQIQLIQPVFSLVWAWLLIGEHISLGTALASVLVIASAALARWTRSS
jgi:drug/metabolite transporter (DMT)-like permease